jgi:uracil-DNA glycosylase
VIQKIGEKKRGVVFLLWGGAAQKKARLVDSSLHHILTAAHPSPLSANKFLGCNHFAQTNQILKSQNQLPIDW